MKGRNFTECSGCCRSHVPRRLGQARAASLPRRPLRPGGTKYNFCVVHKMLTTLPSRLSCKE